MYLVTEVEWERSTFKSVSAVEGATLIWTSVGSENPISEILFSELTGCTVACRGSCKIDNPLWCGSKRMHWDVLMIIIL